MLYGVEDVHNNILDSLRRWTQEPPAKGQSFYVVALFHDAYGPSKEPIQTFQFNPNEDLEGLTIDIVSEAKKAAEEVGAGKIYFTLRMDGNSKAQRRFSLEHGRGEDDNPDELVSDFIPSPTEKGVLGMLMRHQEGTMRLALSGQGDAFRILRSELRDARERIATLEKERIRYLQEFEEILQNNHERELNHRQAERAEVRKDHAIQSLMALGPVVVNKFLGQKAVPTAPGHGTPLEAMLSAFIASLNPDELQRIQGILSPDHLVALLEIFKQVQANEDAFRAQQQSAMGEKPEEPEPTGNVH
jgi:hypothetical protein